MKDTDKTEQNQAPSSTDSIKGWVMVILTFIFVLLYVAALFELINPLKDLSIINRLEPIIFVIIGYYFGRLPAQANESSLKNEINRQTQKADAAQQIKERVQQEREILEEKVKNAKFTLSSPLSRREKMAASPAEMSGSTKQAIETAVKILDS